MDLPLPAYIFETQSTPLFFVPPNPPFPRSPVKNPRKPKALRSAMHLQRRNSTEALEAQRWALRRVPGKRREIDEFDGLNTEVTKQWYCLWWENQSEGMAEEIYQHLNHHPFDENIFETIIIIILSNNMYILYIYT